MRSNACAAVPGLTIYGAGDARRLDDRVGVIAFNLGSVPHALVAAILGYEAGIGVRSGCFCAQSYVAHLLGRGMRPARSLPEPACRAASRRPGMVRLSLGVYNTAADVDALAEMLHRIARREYHGDYVQDPETGEYLPAGHVDAVRDHFSLTRGREHGCCLLRRWERRELS